MDLRWFQISTENGESKSYHQLPETGEIDQGKMMNLVEVMRRTINHDKNTAIHGKQWSTTRSSKALGFPVLEPKSRCHGLF